MLIGQWAAPKLFIGCGKPPHCISPHPDPASQSTFKLITDGMKLSGNLIDHIMQSSLEICPISDTLIDHQIINKQNYLQNQIKSLINETFS